jgi:hypothetical protein
MDRIERIGAERAARRRGGEFFHAKKPPTSSIKSTSRFRSTRQDGNLKRAFAGFLRHGFSSRVGQVKRNLFRVGNADAEQVLGFREMQRDLLRLDRGFG